MKYKIQNTNIRHKNTEIQHSVSACVAPGFGRGMTGGQCDIQTHLISYDTHTKYEIQNSKYKYKTQKYGNTTFCISMCCTMFWQGNDRVTVWQTIPFSQLRYKIQNTKYEIQNTEI